MCAEQVRILTVNQTQPIVDFAQKLQSDAKHAGLRVTLDNEGESVGKKIRNAEVWKVPYTIVVGEKEASSGEITPRIRGDLKVGEGDKTLPVANFLETVANESKSRVSKSSI